MHQRFPGFLSSLQDILTPRRRPRGNGSLHCWSIWPMPASGIVANVAGGLVGLLVAHVFYRVARIVVIRPHS